MIEIDDDMKRTVNGAIESRHPMVLAYVGDDGAPNVSFRGSTQVFGKDQLAIWVRNPSGGLARALQHHPQVALLYGSADPPRLFAFKGRARIDANANDIVYANSPKGERDYDPERKGVALIIDLDEITGFGAAGPVRMTR
jgi:pyridoxamine 5'-phosphate oxidase-like protein